MTGIEQPEFFLLTETFSDHAEKIGGEWRFILQQSNGSIRLEVSDLEPGVCGERLELLAVVRGLEAIDGKSHVTLVTSSRYVGQGVRFGLEQWKDNNWEWEKFGEMKPVNNMDLWQRVDRAMTFHSIECRVWRLQSKNTEQLQAQHAAQKVAAPANTRLSRWLKKPSTVVEKFKAGSWLPQYACTAN